MMGLLAAMLRQNARGRAVGHELSHAIQQTPIAAEADLAPLAYDIPGPPPVPEWNSYSAPLPDLQLVDAGMRPITGGRRRSFEAG